MLRAVAGLFVSLAAVGAAAPDELVIPADGMADASVNNVPFRIHIDPGAASIPLITGSLARQAGLKPGRIRLVTDIGPVRIPGHSNTALLTIAGQATKRRVGWIEQPRAPGVVGTVGPGGLDAKVVRFALRPAVAGERVGVLPLVQDGRGFALGGGRYAGLPVGSQLLKVAFEPSRSRSIATANAGVALASAFGGTLEPGIRSAPITYGVERPLRTLRLGRPLAIGPVELDRLGVRVRDFGNADVIPTTGDGDPEETVLVTGRTKQPVRLRLTLGADVLDRCSSITFDKPRKQVRLSCR